MRKQTDDEAKEKREANLRCYATAQFVSGDFAAVAYSAHRIVPGPNGEAREAFVLRSRDHGATWTRVPLIRTIWSSLRFWGFPVWPPESIDAIDLTGESLCIGFRDAWVPFEPGGESLWKGLCHANGLWTVTRVRLLDYEHVDTPGAAAPIDVNLPLDYEGPSEAILEAAASRVANEVLPRRG